MNINRNTFNQYIADGGFRTLFIREMMWNNPQGQTKFDITVEETTYKFELIAQRNGFQVLTCQVENIPTGSMAKKIDTRLRKQANDYICIYYLPDSQHHLWVAPVNKVEKRDLVLVEYETAASASFLYEKIDSLSFDIDEHTTITDVKERVQGAFLINSEKITRDFYAGFRKEHARFVKFITGMDDEIEPQKNKNKQWYTSVMLNRMMFCYFIQKKGFLDLNVNYLSDKLQWVREEQGEGQYYTFYKGFLCSLFHDGLNSPRHLPDFQRKYGRIPYLNGGMFDEHELEKRYPDIDIADEAFENLFAFFDNWHWHLDDRLTANGRGINPDVLGYIFEQYINDRAQMGAYYTKEDITEYIGRNTIVPFLMDATAKTTPNAFKPEGTVWRFLRASDDTYIYEAVRHGHDTPIPEYIAVGIDTSKPNLLERRSRWNERTPDPWALPTEIWRETVERLQRYQTIRHKIESGEITHINDFITYNLNIRQFVYDFLQQTDDHLFVKHFYKALQKVSILDPTCGSGAFLFAALNILEPLYEICITRMQEWNAQNPHLFEEELRELNGKYRSNVRYFIYKSIILRNLYGVDIMVEATEIAKLRLFLKMVAVVDVNPRDQNLGLDPLPDIDFNIRCGNTLVGYATEKEMEEGVKYMDMFARQEFETKVYDEIDVVSNAYDTFRKIQLEQDSDLETFKNAKMQLKERLAKLNELLNQNLHATTNAGMNYDVWKRTHQPFHWFAEFYEIIYGNGGFDVIIGNPPYVEITKIIKKYKLIGYNTINCGNLYACVFEQSKNISREDSFIGMIVQLPIACTDRMKKAQELLQNRNSWMLTFDDRPGKLFDDLEHIRVTVFLTTGRGSKVYTSKYNRWYSKCRNHIFNLLMMIQSVNIPNICSIPKIGNDIVRKTINRIINLKPISLYYSSTNENPVFVHNAPQYFTRATTFAPYFWNETDGCRLSVSVKPYTFKTSQDSKIACCILNSSTFYLWFIILSDCRHLNAREIDNFPISLEDMDQDIKTKLCNLSDMLMSDYITNSYRKESYYRATGGVVYDEYYPKKSKPIIDEIDKVLAKHYGFTEEELDFIINYDIKYRMGDELNENE